MVWCHGIQVNPCFIRVPRSPGRSQAPDDDSQVWTVGITKVTAGAFFWGYHNGDMPVFVEGQYLGWTKFDTEVTAFTPLGIDEHLSARCFSCPADRDTRDGIGWEVIFHRYTFS